MIPDHLTNKLYLADILPMEHPEFFNRFEKVLKDCGIPFELLPGTKDVWAVDYMPVQTSKDEFIQFRYEPDYLMDSPENKATISNVDAICKAIGIKPIKSNVNLDGGNVTKWDDSVILCEKVFFENEELEEDDLIEELLEHFNVQEEKLFFVPWDENDFTGHADGMVRFVDEKTLLINDYWQEEEEFQDQFQAAIEATGLDIIILPYEPEDDPTLVSAVGLYLNYLEMEQAVIVPVFNLPSDKKAMEILTEVFHDKKVVALECTELARKGGILNCISWNIWV
ncbi:MAG: agmatine deiminase family protein [Flavobacteriales bacterium]|jgi:agmatine deiminase|nr:agmatine deiminase family protein [Flavobacteriales bacterium]